MQPLNNNQDQVAAVRRDVQARIMAAMETGNHGVARTTLREYSEYYPAQAADIAMDVLTAYGVYL